MKRIILLVIVAVLTIGGLQAQNTKTTDAKVAKVEILTNASGCSRCAAHFKENVPFFKGVKDYSFDANTKKITITYDPSKTNPDQLRKEISNIGFDADNVKANPEARAKLQGDKTGETGCKGESKCQGAQGEHKCQGQNGQHQCSGKCPGKEGEHKCQGAQGEPKCQGQNGQHQCSGKCPGKEGEHKCQGAQGEHKCQGQNGQHQCSGKCPGKEGEHKCQKEGEHKCPNQK